MEGEHTSMCIGHVQSISKHNIFKNKRWKSTFLYGLFLFEWVFLNFIIRKYLNCNVLFCEVGADTTRQIQHFHFHAWPDKDVPHNSWSLVNFWCTVDTELSVNEAPIVVHCRYSWFVCNYQINV